MNYCDASFTFLRISCKFLFQDPFRSWTIHYNSNSFIPEMPTYGLPVVTTENRKNLQFSKDYGKLEFYYGNFLKK